jgi:hypothetical protein
MRAPRSAKRPMIQRNKFVEGASASLNLSAKELDDFLNGVGGAPAMGNLRSKYRSVLEEFAEHWFHRGFRRGCMETSRNWKSTGKFPRKVTYRAQRNLFSGQRTPVTLSWP